MAIRVKSSVKSTFETGDRPTQQEFEDFIDSAVFQTSATGFVEVLGTAAATTWSSAGQFLVTVSGASTSRSLEARFHGKSGTFNVLDYGGYTPEAWQAAVSAAHEVGGGDVYGPPGIYDFDAPSGAQVNLTGMHNVRCRGAGAATIIHMTNSGNPFWMEDLSGSDSKTVFNADVSAFQRQVELPGSAAQNDYSRGDYIAFESTEYVFGVVSGATTNVGQAMEIHQVVSQSASSVTLDGPLRFDYTVGASAQFFKPTMTSGLAVMDMQFTSLDPTGDTKQLTMRLRRASNFVIQNVRMTDMGGPIQIEESQDGFVNNLTIDKQANFDNPFGYGLTFNGACSNIIVNNMIGRDCRHAATTLSKERATAASTFHGGPRNITFNNCIGISGEHSAIAIWDTHAYGTHIIYNNCIAEMAATAAAWQVRALDVTLNGCYARGGLQGVDVRIGANDCLISGCTFVDTEGDGVVLRAKRGNLSNSVIKGTRNTAITVQTSASATFITGNKLSDYNRSGNAAGPIKLNFGSRNTVITNNVIPYISSARSTRAIDSGGGRQETVAFNVFSGAWPDNTAWALASGATRIANIIGSAGNNPGGGPAALELTRQTTVAATATGVSLPVSALGFYVTQVSGRDVAVPYFRIS